ncbi:hypothetical protein QYM36_003892 [Artemia franciscana]|uniref:Uncharacterized protein n=1 Tax=Artemia franciscana TaxID=6661 RepID=A0AA88LHC6_ARTSF|nr:hypothetical protein QYM36_003892 [Artemia franciscana]
MNGKRMTLDDRKYEIKHQGQLITSDFLKADIFANTFMNKPLDTVLPNPPQSQTSFRKSHSAMDNIDRIETDMTDALQEGEVGIAVLFD